jgi:hypothetical protein
MTTSSSGDYPNFSDKVIPAQFVQVLGAKPKKHPVHKALPPHENRIADKPHEPKITLVRSGDSVKTIQIECTCGALIELDCEY